MPSTSSTKPLPRRRRSSSRVSKLHSASSSGSGNNTSTSLPPEGSNPAVATVLRVTFMEASRARRILANRESAHRSRRRKADRHSGLELFVNRLRGEVDAKRPHLIELKGRHADLMQKQSRMGERLKGLLRRANEQKTANAAVRRQLAVMGFCSGAGGSQGSPAVMARGTDVLPDPHRLQPAPQLASHFTDLSGNSGSTAVTGLSVGTVGAAAVLLQPTLAAQAAPHQPTCMILAAAAPAVVEQRPVSGGNDSAAASGGNVAFSTTFGAVATTALPAWGMPPPAQQQQQQPQLGGGLTVEFGSTGSCMMGSGSLDLVATPSPQQQPTPATICPSLAVMPQQRLLAGAAWQSAATLTPPWELLPR